MRDLEDYNVLKQELRLVAGVAPFGAHKEVADHVGISERYSKEIRDREGAKLPSEDNKVLIKKMVKKYREIIRKEQDKLKV